MKRSVRFEPDAEATHQKLKKVLMLEHTDGEDSETIKTAEQIALAVLQNLFGGKLSEVIRRASIAVANKRKRGRRKKPIVFRHPDDEFGGQK